ncbi:ATP-binding protein [Fundidesulfovibrio terrae]|uniref:ATP-binding protein n=1 Tax=Fundidesulfovibrio terrae TaxID=2922866 RepID=UPI001FAE860A|nr:ATP-binding protein [Fundidesulfovibrio terrae]
MDHAEPPARGHDRTVPLRLALTLPFVLLILVCSGLIGWFTLDNGRMAVRDVAGQLRTEVLRRVEEHLTRFLAVPHQINAINAQALASGILDLGDPVNRSRYFYGVVATHPLIAYSFFGAPDGEFYGARRSPGGDVEVIHAGADTGGASVYHGASPVGDPLEFRAAFKNFDPRTRPWYKSGAQANGPVWSGVYRHFVLKDLTLTASLPVFGARGALLGVFGVDYALTNIHLLLRTITVGRSGEVFLVERSGELLAAAATPSSGLFSEKDGVTTRLKATQSGLPRIEAAARSLEAQPGGLAAIDKELTLEFDLDGRRQFLQATPFTDGKGIDWLIVAVAPESDFMGRIDANTRQTILMVIVAALLAASAGVIMAARLTRPVERLAKAAQGLSKGRWDLEMPTPNSREIKRLAQAFGSMASQLKASFGELQAKNDIIAEHNRTLELRVESRTAELNHLHDRLRAMFEAIPGYIHVIDKDFTVVDVCDKMLTAVGLTREEVVGRKCHQVFHNLPAACPHCPLTQEESRQAITARPSLPSEEALLGRAFMAYSAPILDEHGEIWGYIECLMDVSALRAAQEELRQAKDQADAANHAKSEFLANMSHEIRTPMNGIFGMLQLLRTTPLDREQQEYVGTGLAALKNLLNLINDILDLSKVEAGKLDIVARPFSLPDLLRLMSGIFKEQLDEKGIALGFEIAPDVPRTVLADAARIRQVLFNLIGNAIKFTEKGRVDVRVQAGGEALQGQVRLFFRVSDTGIGIPQDRLADLFKPFTQIDGSLARKYQGTGLGLSIVKRLVELMGGEVRVESAVGVGTSMHFSILAGAPAQGSLPDEAPPQAETAGPTAAEPSSPLNILLVEDEAINQKAMERLLGKRGHAVVCAGSGEEALKILARQRFDCVLMDVQMPGMDGTQATRLIRSGEGSSLDPGVHIIALTANAMSGDRERLLSAGMDDYLSKPVELDALLQALGRVTPRTRA